MVSDTQYQVSVVVLSFNSRNRLDACLQAIMDQDYPRQRYEVIVVDNASKDGSADYVEQNYPGVRVVRFDRNYGCTEGGNRTVQHVHTRYMAIVNPDCIIHRRWLSEMMEAMTNEPKARLAHSNTIFPWWPEFAAQERENLVGQAYVCDMTLLGIHDYRVEPVTATTKAISTLGAHLAAAMIDLSVIPALGYLADPGFFCYADDLDIALRVNLAGYKVLFVPKAVAYHDTAWKMNLNRWTIRKAMLSTRNTILAFYKMCYLIEFMVMLPLLLLGNIQKARQHALSPIRQWLYILAAIPQTLLGLAEALWVMPSYRQIRRETLRHRTTEMWWVFHRARNRYWKPDPKVWTPGSVKVSRAVPVQMSYSGEEQ